MAKKKTEKPDISPKVDDEPVTGCVICGSYEGTFVAVAGKARAHEACANARPDVIAKVKARA